MARKRSIVSRIAPVRFILFFAVLLAAVPGASWVLNWPEAVMGGFSFAAAIFLGSCIPLFNDEAEQMRRAARDNDANWLILLALTIVLSLVILVTVAGKLTADEPLTAAGKALVVLTLALAWVFANAVYALHYAHLYYTADDGGKDLAGLDFPGDRPEPDYGDFAYFAFTLGVALQTSDVCITSPGIRRTVTVHCIAAFIYNLGVLAMAVNILAGQG
jgi:uncharacterized membrane protein